MTSKTHHLRIPHSWLVSHTSVMLRPILFITITQLTSLLRNNTAVVDKLAPAFLLVLLWLKNFCLRVGEGRDDFFRKTFWCTKIWIRKERNPFEGRETIANSWCTSKIKVSLTFCQTRVHKSEANVALRASIEQGLSHQSHAPAQNRRSSGCCPSLTAGYKITKNPSFSRKCQFRDSLCHFMVSHLLFLPGDSLVIQLCYL